MEDKITKGKWVCNKDGGVTCVTVEQRAKKFGVSNIDGEILQCWADVHNNKILPNEECEANQQLVCEAGNVLQETGLTPKQLQERVEVLEKGLQWCFNYATKDKCSDENKAILKRLKELGCI